MAKLHTHNLRVRRMLGKGLKLATPTLRDIATAAGLKYNTVRRYREGIRTPPPDVLLRLADALQGRSKELAKLAMALRREATRGKS